MSTKRDLEKQQPCRRQAIETEILPQKFHRGAKECEQAYVEKGQPLNDMDPGSLSVRPTTVADLPRLLELYRRARAYMVSVGNPTQWIEGYPSLSLLQEDIAQGTSFVVLDAQGVIVAGFVFWIGAEPTYSVLEGGEWLNEDPYGVIHRLASWGRGSGIASFVLQWCWEQIANLRVDTHLQNAPMRHILDKMGFSFCGRIYLADGSMRLAYHKVLW